MNSDNTYKVKEIFHEKNFGRLVDVEVPGSKSITNRALLIAALSEGETALSGALFSNDAADMISALKSLGIDIRTDEKEKHIIVKGCGGCLPLKKGRINVGNAGTAARFIAGLLGFSGGVYRLDAASQMKKRPMKPLLDALQDLNVKITYEEKEGYFPFILDSSSVRGGEITLDTTVSSQFLSAILMAAPMLDKGITLNITGVRKSLPYVDMTLRVMQSFGEVPEASGNKYIVTGGCKYNLGRYEIEPDVSAACYFYGMAELLGCKALVRGVHLDSIQGDIAFVRLLEKMGASVRETADGILLTGSGNGEYNGVDVDMNAFSDQTLTLAALSLFAKTPTKITGVGHIRFQESDRLSAIKTEFSKLGVECTTGEDFIKINPLGVFSLENEKVQNIEIETYNDHRVAMAFSLIGLRRAGVVIKNPDCSAKTFKNYFKILTKITSQR